MEYAVRFHGMSGTATQHLTLLEKEVYRFDNITEPDSKLLPVEAQDVAFFRKEKGRIQPLRTEQRTKAFYKDTEKTIIYDNSRKEIHQYINQKHYIYPLEADIYDEVTIVLQLMEDLKSEKKEMQYQVIGNGKLKRIQFTVLGTTWLTDHQEKIPAIQVRRNQIGKDDREVNYWFSAEANPHLIRHLEYRKGEVRSESLLRR